MRAYADHVILKPIPPKDTTESGLYVKNGVGDTRNVAEVIDVADGFFLEVGDKVIFASGKTFTHDRQDYIVCKRDEILVVL